MWIIFCTLQPCDGEITVWLDFSADHYFLLHFVASSQMQDVLLQKCVKVTLSETVYFSSQNAINYTYRQLKTNWNRYCRYVCILSGLCLHWQKEYIRERERESVLIVKFWGLLKIVLVVQLEAVMIGLVTENSSLIYRELGCCRGGII